MVLEVLLAIERMANCTAKSSAPTEPVPSSHDSTLEDPKVIRWWRHTGQRNHSIHPVRVSSPRQQESYAIPWLRLGCLHLLTDMRSAGE